MLCMAAFFWRPPRASLSLVRVLVSRARPASLAPLPNEQWTFQTDVPWAISRTPDAKSAPLPRPQVEIQGGGGER
jgi:hypothetical protein